MKLHLGCGKRFIPGFYHIDAVPFEHVHLVHAVDDLSMVESESVDLAYACHVLEHFSRKATLRVLNEWRRMLRQGGVLRLAVPDFAALAKLYIETGDLGKVIGPLFGRGDYLYNCHFTVFDFVTLKQALEQVGFRDVRRYDWRTTEHADVDDYSRSYYPHMDFNGLLLSLNVEATK